MSAMICPGDLVGTSMGTVIGETDTEGTNRLAGQDAKKIVNAAREILWGKTKRGRVPAL